MNNTSSILQSISDKVQSILRHQMTPYIHCSKINNILQILQAIPSELKSQTRKMATFTNIQNNAFVSIVSILEQFQELFQSCSRDNCVHFILTTTSITATKTEIAALRDAAVSAFKQLDQKKISDSFKITKEGLNSQDEVDMKRIAQILIQISQKNREDISKQVAQRFNSLKKLGIDVSPDVKCDVKIPDLPQILNYVVKHEDIELGKQIGKGQSGTVMLGKFKDGKLKDLTVAVKILFRRALSQPEFESYRREIFVLSMLNFPTLLKFYGYTEEPPFYIVTDYMPNGSLFDVFRKSPEKLTPTHRTLIALDVARGLEYLHSKGIIHRDLKSLNVLLDSKLRAKICDFGMVRTKGNAPMTGMIGTPHWMAPEVLMSSPTYDDRVDVYSFGIFLWELLTNDMPYNGMKQVEITIGVTQGTLRPPIPDTILQNCATSSSKLIALIEKCWDQEPEKRPSMSKVVSELSQHPKCHFPDTDEALFQTEAGIVIGKHRSTASQVVVHHRSRRSSKHSNNEGSLDNLDFDFSANLRTSPSLNSNSENAPNRSNKRKSYSNKNNGNNNNNYGISDNNDLTTFMMIDLISQIEAASGSARQSLMKTLCESIKDKITADEIANANGCRYIAECLTMQCNLTEIALKSLLTCKSHMIFDVDVLKSLLQFADNENQELRQKALSVLIVASNLRFDFLVSAPSFLLQLLFFLKKPIQTHLANSLLQLSKKLIGYFKSLPEGVVQLLIWAKNNVEENNLRPILVNCLALALKFESAKVELCDENLMKELLKAPIEEKLIDAYLTDNININININSNKMSAITQKCDEIFISTLCSQSIVKNANIVIWKKIICANLIINNDVNKNNKNKKLITKNRFVFQIIKNLPIGGKHKYLTPLYTAIVDKINSYSHNVLNYNNCDDNNSNSNNDNDNNDKNNNNTDNNNDKDNNNNYNKINVNNNGNNNDNSNNDNNDKIKNEDNDNERSNENKTDLEHNNDAKDDTDKEELSAIMRELAEHSEFYTICAHIISRERGKIYDFCEALKKFEFYKLKILCKTKLINSLCTAFLEADEAGELLPLMAVIYLIALNINQVKNFSAEKMPIEFAQILPKLFKLMYLNGEFEVFRMPSFICISEIYILFSNLYFFILTSSSSTSSNNNNNNLLSFVNEISFEFDKILRAAAFFVNCDVKIARESAAKVFHELFVGNIDIKSEQKTLLYALKNMEGILESVNVDAQNVAVAFVCNFQIADENTREVARILIEEANKRGGFSAELVKKISEIREK